MGRQTTATPAAKQEILDRLSQGEPLADICRDKHMPCVAAVRLWKLADDDFDSGFARARTDGHDAIATRVRHTARGLGESSGDVQRDKLIIDTDLKLLAKWDRRYSDKLVVEGKQEVTHKYDLDSLGNERLDALEAILADAARGSGSTSEAEPTSIH